MSASPNSPSTAATHALRVESLHKQYGKQTAVEALSFTVARGEIVGLLGPNGAGKTTTINMVLGVLEPTRGSIHIGRHDVRRQRAQALALTNFAAVYAPLPGNLSVEQNLRFFGLIYGVPQLRARMDELIEHFELQGFRKTKCGVLSSGEQTRVCLAKALLNRPQLLLLDEPTASIDPASARTIRKMIRAIAASGDTGILWTSHNMHEVEEVCDRVLLLARGRILLQGDPRELPRQHGAATLEDLFVASVQRPADKESV